MAEAGAEQEKPASAPSIEEQAQYRRDCDSLWPGLWHRACRFDELEDAGSIVEFRVANLSAIIVRGSGGVRAFHNRCTHRGVRIVDESGRCSDGLLTCPFHGWRWDFEGRNRFHLKQHLVNQKDRDPATLDLSPCRIEVVDGRVFLNFDHAAPDLSPVPAASGAGEEHSVILALDWRRAFAALGRVLHERLDEADHAFATMRAASDTTDEGGEGDHLALAPAIAMMTSLLRERAVRGGPPVWVQTNHLDVAIEGGRFSLRVRSRSASRCQVDMWLDLA